MQSTIPVIDLAPLLQNSGSLNINSSSGQLHPKAVAVIDEIHVALKDVGCFYLVNHGVSEEIIQKGYDASTQFFSLPREVKEKYRKCSEKSTHGWVEAGQELLNVKSVFELRECFDYIHPSLRHNKDFPVTLPEYPEFYETIESFRQECNPLVRKLLVILGHALKLEDPEFFLKCSTHLDNPGVPNESDFRTVYYPPISNDDIVATNNFEGRFRCAEHTDYKTITLLIQDDAGGLEVRHSSTGEWIHANPVPKSILVIMGDLLEFWTSGYFKATAHRVRFPQATTTNEGHNNKGVPRYSFAYFVPPDSSTLICPLQSEILKTSDDAEDSKPFTAYEHIMMKCKRAYQY